MVKLKMVIAAIVVFVMTGCASYGTAVQANKENHKEFTTLLMGQHLTIQKCYDTNPNKSECSILASSVNAMHSLIGKPDAIRVPKTAEEIAESIAKYGLDTAFKIYGVDAVSSVVKAGLASAGKVQIVRPEVIQPEPIFAYPLSQVQ